MGSDDNSSISFKDAHSIATSSSGTTASDANNQTFEFEMAPSSSNNAQGSDLRCEERLKIKIGEAKRLPGPGKGGTGARDVYVTINLDREEIFRTSVIEKTLNPFFGEEFSFEIPRRFRTLSFYVYDAEINRNLMLIKNKKEKKLSKSISYVSNPSREMASTSKLASDKIIGKVSVKRENLAHFNAKDHWFKLTPVTEDSEISGKILFSVKLIDQLINPSASSSGDATTKKVSVRVLECDDLTLINGTCDPFVVVTLNCLTKNKRKDLADNSVPGGSVSKLKFKKIQSKRTKIRKKTNTPLFDETFYLDLPNCSTMARAESVSEAFPKNQEKFALSNLIVNLSVYHDGPSSIIGNGTTFLGQVNVPLSSILDAKNSTEDYTRWHLLQPRTNVSNCVSLPRNGRSATLQQSISTLPSSVSDYQSTSSTLPKISAPKEDFMDLGSLRLKINYTSDYVLNSRYYANLKKLVYRSPFVKPVTSSTAFILGEILGNSKTELASSMVKLFIASDATFLEGKNENSKNLHISGTTEKLPKKEIDTDQNMLLLAFIRSFGEWEISKVTDANTIFRGNTLLSKFLDELMRFTGSKYLHETLKDSVLQIIREKKNCEIDSSRLKDANELKENMNNLLIYLHAIFKSIITSVILCPKIMRDAFAILKELSLKYFPGMREISYSVISGFIFLRFFAPAILNPKLFDIINDSSITIEPVSVRTLTLISKTIQMMGNLVSCKIADADAYSKKCGTKKSVDSKLEEIDNQTTRRYSLTSCFKEDFMANLQRAFVTDEYIDSTRMFLEMISSPTSVSISNHLTLDRSIVLKDGYLVKKSGSKNLKKCARESEDIVENLEPKTSFISRFRSKNKFRKRYFVLSTHTLSYYVKKSKKAPNTGGVLRWSIPITDLVSIQKGAELSLRNQRILCLKYIQKTPDNFKKTPIKTLFLKASNCVEEQEWFNVLSRVVTCNENSSRSNQINDLISDAVDADREIARIQSLLVSKEDAMNQLYENCTNMIKERARGDNNSASEPLSTSVYNMSLIEDPKTFIQTLDALKSAMNQLRIDEEMFIKKEVIDTVYGSKSTPIGDDHYLSLIKKHVN